jgi:phage virion morphogenesis protein|nr:MAG TPA: virion morphogenesis protein [Caudoviricetes sp.]
MGAVIKVDFSGISKLQSVISNLDRRFSPGKNLMMSIAATLRSTTQDRFSTKLTPDGKTWSSSLVKSGDLRKKLDIDANDTTAIVGSNLEYAAIHQFGGVIKPKKAKVLAFNVGGKNIFANKVTIKANPYLGISESDEDEIAATIQDFFDESIKA